MLVAAAVAAGELKMPSGKLLLNSVLCSIRQVMEGLVRPFCRLMMIAWQMTELWTMLLMCSGLEMAYGLMERLQWICTFEWA
jgi:hypothetical protein